MNKSVHDELAPGSSRVGTPVLSASALAKNDVYNLKGEKLSSVKEFMLDIKNGRVCYVVMSFGGFMGMGEKLFAVPWAAMAVDTKNRRFLMDVHEDQLKAAQGFDPDNWPDMADPTWESTVHANFGIPY